ncbi:MAG: hypothetical protein KA028_00560 [Candidatus Pacebacteria bacterium]|nr:hypothetical protein [Candidatus Paceibacterota bacterium]MBP9851695.1 hypothetical protein [Candidatus Paceibacterota bacterium]
MKDPILRDEFESRTGLKMPISAFEVDRIVPLRDIVTVVELKIMPEPYLEGLLRNVTLEGDASIQPYKDAKIQHYRLDPTNLNVAQTFVERQKYQRLIEVVSDLFNGFHINRGFAKCTALIVIGKTACGNLAVAHYLPPLVEMHTGQSCLIDGTHRNYLTASIGTTIESIILSNVYEPPCQFGCWKDVKIVSEKPPRNERYVNLNVGLFRNLGHCGIDG